MADPARLSDLRRQRELIEQHLAWIDREIAAVEQTATKRPPVPAELGPLAAPVAASSEADFEQFRTPAADVRKDVRRGCLIYFAAALLLLGMAVAVLYYALRR